MKSTSIRIGNQTSFSARSPLEPFEFALANGFQAFEFFPDCGPNGDQGWDERAMSLDEREFIRRAASNCGLTITVHAPLALKPLEGLGDGRLESTIQLALDLDARLVVIHFDLSHGVDAFGESLRPVLKGFKKAKLKLALENTVWTGPEEVNQFFAWLRTNNAIQAKLTGLCFDLGHANVCSATQNDYLRFLDQLDPEVPILHLHLHENFGDRDCHLTLFTGPSQDNDTGIRGLVNRLHRRAFRGSAIFEQWPQPPDLLIAAKDRLDSIVREEVCKTEAQL